MGAKPTGKPTSFDIAYLAGVSQPTVSRALRGSKSVSQATRERILEIARDLHYSVDKNASSLRSQRANTLALLFFEEEAPEESSINPFFLAMLASITRACATRGFDLLISFQKMEDDWHVRYQDAHRADGLILLGYGDYTHYEPRLRALVAAGTHFVRWGAVDDGSIGATVGSDNVAAGRLAGDHLLGLGRRRIAFLGGVGEDCPEFSGRYRGLCQALAAGGLQPDPALLVPATSLEDSGAAATRALLARGADFDAVFAASDLIAIGAMRALAEAGRRVPEDVAVVGFDDLPAASLTNPPLTTLAQDLKGAGTLLVETLLAQVLGEPSPSATIPARLVVRRSCGA